MKVTRETPFPKTKQQILSAHGSSWALNGSEIDTMGRDQLPKGTDRDALIIYFRLDPITILGNGGKEYAKSGEVLTYDSKRG